MSADCLLLETLKENPLPYICQFLMGAYGTWFVVPSSILKVWLQPFHSLSQHLLSDSNPSCLHLVRTFIRPTWITQDNLPYQVPLPHLCLIWGSNCLGIRTGTYSKVGRERIGLSTIVSKPEYRMKNGGKWHRYSSTPEKHRHWISRKSPNITHRGMAIGVAQTEFYQVHPHSSFDQEGL